MTAPEVRHELERHQQALRERLAGVRRRLRWQLVLEGAAWLVAATAALMMTSLILDWQLRLDRPWRIGGAAASALALLALAVRRLVMPLRAPLGDMDLAVLLERRHPGFAQQAASILQLPALVLDPKPTASPALVRLAVATAARHLAGISLRPVVGRRRTGWACSVVLGVVVVLGTGAAAAPEVASLWAQRWLLGSTVRWPQRTYLTLVGLDGGRLLVPRGETVTLQVDADPEFTRTPEGWSLEGRGEPFVVASRQPPTPTVPDRVSIAYRNEAGVRHHGVFTRFGTASFRYELPGLQLPTDITLAAEDDRLGPIRIEPAERPTVAEWTLRATFPGKSGREETLSSQGQRPLLFLPDTQLEWSFTASEPIASAALTAGAASAPQLERIDERTFRTRWKLTAPLTLELQLSSAATRLGSRPFTLPFGLLQDREPRVSLRSTGVGRRVTPMARLPLVVSALDDFGIARMEWESELTIPRESQPEKKSRKQVIENGSGSELPLERQCEATIALREEGLPPGALVRVRALATDDGARGPQTGASRWLSFQVVSHDELFYEILTRQRAERARFKAAADLASEQREALANPLDAAAIAGLVRRHQVLARQVWQVAGRLEATHVEMTLNELGTPQARKMLAERIVAPMRELHAGLLEQQRRQLEDLASDREPASAKVEAAARLQPEIQRAMQRLLDQMAQWESFVDVVNQLREVMGLQSRVQEAVETLRQERVKGVFDD